MELATGRRAIPAAAALAALVTVIAIALAGCASPGARWQSLSQDTQWGKDLKAVLDEAGVDDVSSVETRVTLDEKEGGRFKVLTGADADKDYDTYVTREVTVKTDSGRTLTISCSAGSGYLSLTDADRLVDYWRAPGLEGSAFDLVSYKTGELLQAKDPEMATALEARVEEAERRAATTTDLTRELEQLGYSHEQAWAIQETMSEVGVGRSSGVRVLADNAPLRALAAECNGHQVNITTEEGTLSYVQITGWPDMEYGWYVNWRGKLRYGIVDKKLAFDLYDSSQEDGYLACYRAADDSVVPWSER